MNGTAAAFSLTEGGKCHLLQSQTRVGPNQNSNVMGKQTLAPLLSREQVMVPVRGVWAGGSDAAHTDCHPRILVVEVVPHAEKPSAFSLRAPPLALWDTLWESKTVKRGRTTWHDLEQGQETPWDTGLSPGDTKRHRLSHCLFRRSLWVAVCIRTLTPQQAAFSSIQLPQGGGIKAQSDHFAARASQCLAPRFKVPQSQQLHPDITFNSE